jgi:hypothetical protein
LSWRERLFGSDNSQEEELEIDEGEAHEPNPLEDTALWHHGETVIDIVRNYSSAKGIPVEKTAKGIGMAVDEGRVRLVDPSPPRNLLIFATSLYSYWFWAVVAFIGLLMLSIYLIPQNYPFIYLRYFVAALFVLFVPGYVLIETLYPKAYEMDRLERLVLNVGLSLAIVPLIGLALNYTPWGISLNPIIASLSALVLVVGVLGVWRKYLNHKLSLAYLKKG